MPRRELTRRAFLEASLRGGAGLAAWSLTAGGAEVAGAAQRGPASRTLPLDRDWRFGGRLIDGSTRADFDDSGFARVTIPHTVTDLSWREWDPAAWEDVFVYRRRFDAPQDAEHHRIFLDFGAVNVAATTTLNGTELGQHRGGYLPFGYEVTDLVHERGNVLAVAVDSRWLSVPPEGSPEGAAAVDFFQPGGIFRGVALRAVPQVFVKDVFAKPVDVLAAGRRLEATCTIDAAVAPRRPVRLDVSLRDGARMVDRGRAAVQLTGSGEQSVTVTLDRLDGVTLWDVDDPHLYDVEVELSVAGQPVHAHRTRVGFREARFERDGFSLNGRRLKLFGLNRHELFPYTGFAMPERVLLRDAHILKHELNCNMVRCSHYPQSAAFLDACDELGLLVWEELPGWHYIGDQAWQDLAVRDVEAMVVRDRNRPSVVVWGVRINESANNLDLYTRTREAAKGADDSRPTAGALNGDNYNTTTYLQDVFAYNDYSGTERLRPPRPDFPYLVTEAVGQWPKFKHFYRRIDTGAVQQEQAVYHAQVHDQAASDDRYCGLLAWAAFDYGSIKGSTYQNLKWSGVVDTFRVPKPGAAIYQSQVDPAVRPVIQPAFYWHFGDPMPDGPGADALIASNCQRLELFVGGEHHATVTPDRTRFPHLPFAPSFADFAGVRGEAAPELRIDGYVEDRLVLSRSFAADRTNDSLSLVADDDELDGDGIDATRVVFRAVDRYGAPRPYIAGAVDLSIKGPGEIVGDNPFPLADAGGVGAVWVRGVDGAAGAIRLTATHPLGSPSVTIRLRRAPDRARPR